MEAEDEEIVLCGEGGDWAGAGICDARLASFVRGGDPGVVVPLLLVVYDLLGVGIPPVVLRLEVVEFVRGWGMPDVLLDDAVE